MPLQTSTATFNVEVVPNSDMYVSPNSEPSVVAVVDQRHSTLNIPKTIGLTVDFTTAAGGAGTFKLKDGDRSTSKTVPMGATAIQSLYRYPFDKYSVSVQ